MKLKFPLYLVLAGICSLPGFLESTQANATEILEYSNGDLLHTEEAVITDLGGRTDIYASADSWRALVAKVKPAFAWNDRDMMWIETNEHGQPKFVLDEAYLYQPTNQTRQWVLLRSRRDKTSLNPPPVEPRFFDAGRNRFSVATLHDQAPHSDGGETYAVALSSNKNAGMVYEIGWQREMGNGSAHPEFGRLIYVLKDPAGQWHFLGEGPEEGGERGGGQMVTSRVTWDTAPTNRLPLKIQFVSETVENGYQNNDPRTNSFITYEECVLAGAFPAKLRPTTTHPYLLAEAGDTFDKIVKHCVDWRPDWGYAPNNLRDRERRKNLDALWRAALAKLNPKLPQHGEIKTGTRIQVLTYAEVFDQLESMDKAESK
jgi:hypothetical protein